MSNFSRGRRSRRLVHFPEDQTCALFIRGWQGSFSRGWVAALLLTPTARGGDVGFVEDFALAKDRTTALKQLIPGTEDYYYYHCLHYLNTEQFDKVEALTRPWHERHGQTARLTEIQTRHALLTYEKNPKKTLDYLRNRLGLHFDHQKETLGAAPNLPTALDPKLIARAHPQGQFARRAGATSTTSRTSALDWLAADNLDWERAAEPAVSGSSGPTFPNLPKLVADDLNVAEHAAAFGGVRRSTGR